MVAPPLELVTFEELVARISEFKHRALADDTRAGWVKLLEVASNLASNDDTEGDLTAGHTWHLTSARIIGYQGIGEQQPLEISLDPRPGITVVHGPNGSGKSSIADAIETALQGKTRPAALVGTGGNAPIWERHHCGRDADEALIDLELLDGEESLKLHCGISKTGETTQFMVTRHRGAHTTVIDLGRTGWRSAVVGHRPVYAYAAIERQVQLAKNLQQFLEELLAFGACFETLRAEVERRSGKAAWAKRAWEDALRGAQQQVRVVDEERRADGRTSLDQISWPSVVEEPDAWLEREGLTETGDALPEITNQYLDRLRAAAGAVDDQLARLETAETSLHARLAGPLKDLHAQASRIEQPGSVCPVCGAQGVAWTDHLSQAIDGLLEIESLQRSYRTAGSTHREIARDLAGVRTIISARDREETEPEWWLGSVKPFLDAEHAAGDRITPALRLATTSLVSWIRSAECERLIADAAAESDYLRQWRRARRAVIVDLIATWQSVGVDAREAATWDSVTKRLTTLQNTLREERAVALGEQTNSKVKELLADVGITLRSITVQGRQASLEILDQQGKTLELAMLSAGQRNALLLAPMPAVSGGGPFGFLILDDPVHAFDQIRVDRLAAVIAEVASTRRVVVLTHDERLKEHLLARHPNCDVLAVERDPLTGVVTAAVQGEMWQVLLDDARGLVDTAIQQGGVALAPHDIVRGLCRQAFDNALRSFVVRGGLQDGRNSDADLAVLDDQDTTKARITAARRLLPAGSPRTLVLNEATSSIDRYLTGWNRAAHGNEPTDAPSLPALRAETQAAERACQALTDARS